MVVAAIVTRPDTRACHVVRGTILDAICRPGTVLKAADGLISFVYEPPEPVVVSLRGAARF